jgi:hypothetical protein
MSMQILNETRSTASSPCADGRMMAAPTRSGPAATARMQTSIRPIALAVLLGLGTMAAQAQVRSPDAPAAAAPVTPIDLTLGDWSVPAATRPVGLPHAVATAAPSAASPDLDRITRWIAETRNNGGLPYLVIDKVGAKVLAFDGAGRLQATAPVLLGMARGDKMLAPNDATMEQMPPSVRITPAGRFVSRLARDAKGAELLVLDYAASLSLHPVALDKPKERRAERLNSETPDDNRISFGCINVPTAFYKTVVSPAFTGTKGIVYVLPETGSATALFGLDSAGAVASGAQPGPAASAAQGTAGVGAQSLQANMAPAAK